MCCNADFVVNGWLQGEQRSLVVGSPPVLIQAVRRHLDSREFAQVTELMGQAAEAADVLVAAYLLFQGMHCIGTPVHLIGIC